jgi:hypothetical protein
MEKVIQELEQIIREASKKSYDVPNYVVYFGGKKLGEWNLYSAQASDGEVRVGFSHKGTEIIYSNRVEKSYEVSRYGLNYQYHPIQDKAVELLNLIK